MGQHLLTTVGDLATIVAVVTGTVAFIAYQAGRWVGRSECADERAVLRLELKLARDDRNHQFIDLADRFDLVHDYSGPDGHCRRHPDREDCPRVAGHEGVAVGGVPWSS